MVIYFKLERTVSTVNVQLRELKLNLKKAHRPKSCST